MTTSLQLRTVRPHLNLVIEDRDEHHAQRSTLVARCSQPRADPAIRPLTPLSCSVNARPCGRAFLKHQDQLHRPRVNADGFPNPRRLPSTSAPSQLSPREPATILTALPPRAGFRRFFAPSYALASSDARPSTVVTGYSPVIVRTRRRLSTSAIVTRLRAQPLDRPNSARYA